MLHVSRKSRYPDLVETVWLTMNTGSDISKVAQA